MSPLLWIALSTIAALTVGLTVYSYLRARSREVASHAPPNVASQSAPVAVADEVRAIGEQIERAMAEQRIQGETQRQLLAQKLDSVRQSVDGQRTQVDGLRSELRHEVQRRDAEIDEIRQQLGAIARGGALPPAARPALPAAPEAPRATASAPMIEETTFAPSPPLSAPDAPFGAPTTPAPVPPAEPPASFPEETFEEAAFEDASSDGPAPEPAPGAEAPSFEETSFEEATFEAAPSPSADPFAEVLVEASAPVPPPVAAPSAGAPPVEDVSFEEDAPFEEASFEEDAPFEEDATFEEASFEEDAPFEEASFEEDAPFEETSFDEVLAMSPAPPAPSFHDVRFADPSPPSSEDAFAAASLHVGGDSAPAGDAFDEWTPEAVAPVAAPPAAAVVAAPASRPTAAAPQPPDPEAAWVARPDRQPPVVAELKTASMEDFVFPTAKPTPQPTPEPTPEPEPASAPTAAPETGLIDLDDLAAPAGPEPMADAGAGPADPVADPDPEPEPAPADDAEATTEPEGAPVPEGAEDLTVISIIDEDLQRLLYQEGVVTLEEIAQWGRGEARRISTRVSVPEETIMNQWVFEAQAALFSRYSKQATS